MMVVKKKTSTQKKIAEHPITWSIIKGTAITVAAIIATCFSVWGVTVGWLDGRYEKKIDGPFALKTDTDAQFKEVVTRFTSEVSKLNTEFVSMRTGAQRNIAWLFVGQVRAEWTATNNRVRDCRVKKDDAKLSSSDRANCMQYEDDLKEVAQRLHETMKAAQDASK